jgi:hypothetical protein
MWIYAKPLFEWSGKKFQARYGLGEFDFYDNGNGSIVTKVELPDNPPIFEAPDPIPPMMTKFGVGLPSHNPNGFKLDRTAAGEWIRIPYWK